MLDTGALDQARDGVRPLAGGSVQSGRHSEPDREDLSQRVVGQRVHTAVGLLASIASPWLRCKVVVARDR